MANHPPGQERRIIEFARRIGTVSAAAAALLASGTANAHESRLLANLLDRVVAIQEVQSPAPSISPLILKPSQAKSDLILAGHRSHSSHSSHSSHRSHFSSSTSGSRVRDTSVSPSSTGSNLASDEDSKPTRQTRSTKTPPTKAAPQKTPDSQYEPPANVDLENPLERYELMSIIPNTPGKERAFVKDIKTGKARLYDVGHKIDDYLFVSANTAELSIELKKGDAEAISLKKVKSGK